MQPGKTRTRAPRPAMRRRGAGRGRARRSIAPYSSALPRRASQGRRARWRPSGVSASSAPSAPSSRSAPTADATASAAGGVSRRPSASARRAPGTAALTVRHSACSGTRSTSGACCACARRGRPGSGAAWEGRGRHAAGPQGARVRRRWHLLITCMRRTAHVRPLHVRDGVVRVRAPPCAGGRAPAARRPGGARRGGSRRRAARGRRARGAAPRPRATPRSPAAARCPGRRRTWAAPAAGCERGSTGCVEKQGEGAALQQKECPTSGPPTRAPVLPAAAPGSP